MEIPIVVLTYDRDRCLARLLQSLDRAEFDSDVKLIISIDGGGPGEVLEVAEKFTWKYGEKELVHHQVNLGFKEHMLFCGSLSADYDGIILLEDDLYVSKHFYQYVRTSAAFYRAEDSIAGISLYSLMINETASLPFRPIEDGFDCFFIQLACTWGHFWTRNQWLKFEHWFQNNSSFELSHTDEEIPPDVRGWPQTSIKKHITKYLIKNDLYFVYPRTSYTNCIGDVGMHHKGTSVFQVPLQSTDRELRLVSLADSLVKYDSYLELVPSSVKQFTSHLSVYDFDVDLYGMKPNSYSSNTYVITTRPCTDPIKSYGRVLKPHEMNVIEEYEGSEIYLVSKENVSDYADYKTYRVAVSSDYVTVHPYFYSLYPHQYDAVKKHCSDAVADVYERSWSFRIGHALTYPVRFISRILNK